MQLYVALHDAQRADRADPGNFNNTMEREKGWQYAGCSCMNCQLAYTTCILVAVANMTLVWGTVVMT